MGISGVIITRKIKGKATKFLQFIACDTSYEASLIAEKKMEVDYIHRYDSFQIEGVTTEEPKGTLLNSIQL